MSTEGMSDHEFSPRTGGFIKLIGAAIMLAIQWLGYVAGELYVVFLVLTGFLGLTGLWELVTGRQFVVVTKALEDASGLVKLMVVCLTSLVFGLGAWWFFNGWGMPKFRPA